MLKMFLLPVAKGKLQAMACGGKIVSYVIICGFTYDKMPIDGKALAH